MGRQFAHWVLSKDPFGMAVRKDVFQQSGKVPVNIQELKRMRRGRIIEEPQRNSNSVERRKGPLALPGAKTCFIAATTSSSLTGSSSSQE